MGYTMVCCYTNVTDENVPPMTWVREVYDLLPRKYKKNLKHLHGEHQHSAHLQLMTLTMEPFSLTRSSTTSPHQNFTSWGVPD